MHRRLLKAGGDVQWGNQHAHDFVQPDLVVILYHVYRMRMTEISSILRPVPWSKRDEFEVSIRLTSESNTAHITHTGRYAVFGNAHYLTNLNR